MEFTLDWGKLCGQKIVLILLGLPQIFFYFSSQLDDYQQNCVDFIGPASDFFYFSSQLDDYQL